MKILVLSDSHSFLSFMEQCIDQIQPDAVLHLGDHFEDGEAMKDEFFDIPFYQVPGNCDCFCRSADQCEDLLLNLDGVKIFLTHGHKYRVKQSTSTLLTAGRELGADAVVYGHTHNAECYCEPDGMWVLNPGTCGYFSGSAGLILTENKKIQSCRILRQGDLEDIK